MKIFNTLTMRKEEFVPIEPGKIRMYVCGPTVYNFIHIGNARPMIVFDTFRRYMEHKGYDVDYVSNFTDVDDKIIKEAIEEKCTANEIAEKYIAECKKDMAGMNIEPATTNPRATHEIDGMIDMISKLIEEGHAYVKNGTVYFSTRSFPGYGKLSGKNLDDLRSGFREIKVTGEEEKNDPLDFVLWKPKKEGEPFWESPWSEGRPGWHIECSVMAKRYLGDTIDIHAGGEDLVFPHHENEIAQSECANHAPFAHYWMHNAFLNINGVKMSKSLGNFFTVRDISKEYDLEVLRFFMLSAHYRTTLNFSRELMEAAKTSLDRIHRAASRLEDIAEHADKREMSDEERKVLDGAKAFIAKFDEKMDDDCNTADAEAVVFDLVRYANTNVADNAPAALAQGVLDVLTELCGILGIHALKKEKSLDADIEALIEKRQAARKARDFATADKIRDDLLKQGIELMDTREGVKWKRV